MTSRIHTRIEIWSLYAMIIYACFLYQKSITSYFIYFYLLFVICYFTLLCTFSNFNQVVVLTGANTQFGEALARAFYGAGCKMVLVGSNRQELERVRTELFSLRPKDIPVYQPEVVPMGSSELEFSVNEKVAEIMEMCGQIDILINNSTICTRSDVLSTNIDGDICVMNVNYFGPLAFTKGISNICVC